MKLLNHHSWKKVDYAFKTWECTKCGCVRYWDNILERMVFVKGSEQRYTVPDCNSIINCDPVLKQMEIVTK